MASGDPGSQRIPGRVQTSHVRREESGTFNPSDRSNQIRILNRALTAQERTWHIAA
jgi:hypothetical protein